MLLQFTEKAAVKYKYLIKNGVKLVSGQFRNLENKGDLKLMKLGIVVQVPYSYISIYPYKSL